MRRGKQSRLRVEPLEDRCLPSADFVFQWNDLLLDVQRVRAQGNPQSARALAIMGAAVYDSVNAIDPTHRSSTSTRGRSRAHPPPRPTRPRRRRPTTSPTRSTPSRRSAAPSTNCSRPNWPRSPTARPRTDGIALGQYVAAGMLAWRANDGSGAVVPYTPGTDPGDWQPTPRPNPTPPPAELPGLPASSPQWPYVTPFALTGGDQFRPGPPPALTDADYTEAYREVKALGGDGTTTPTTRTPEQTEIAYYWAGLGVSNAGVAIWNRIAATAAAAHDLTLAENARLFAQLNVANADAFIASYDAKYAYNFWRPVTAIRAADTDGNPDTVADPTWTPLIPTPNHPSYGSNHSAQSRAAAEALAAFFGTDHVSFTATGGGEITRSYARFTDAAKEAGKSRVYAGIHWSFDSAAGEALGRKVGQYVAGHYFRPLTGASGGSPAAPARRQAAGVDTPARHGVDVRIADPWVGLPGKPSAGSPGRTTPRPRGAGSPLPRPSRFPGSPRPAIAVSQAGWTGPPPRFTWSVLRPAEATGGRSS